MFQIGIVFYSISLFEISCAQKSTVHIGRYLRQLGGFEKLLGRKCSGNYQSIAHGATYILDGEYDREMIIKSAMVCMARYRNILHITIKKCWLD